MAILTRNAPTKKRKRMPIVGAVMTSFPYFVEADDTAATMERMMDEHNIRHLPVQENGTVVGIVSERDLHHQVRRGALVRCSCSARGSLREFCRRWMSAGSSGNTWKTCFPEASAAAIQPPSSTTAAVHTDASDS
jgi:CBS-domain-containing membrane protein